MNYNQQIAKLKADIIELEKKKLIYDNLTESQRLAETLHTKLCHHNHTDGCGWFYEKWDKPGYSRKEYVEKADKILQVCDYQVATQVINLL